MNRPESYIFFLQILLYCVSFNIIWMTDYSIFFFKQETLSKDYYYYCHIDAQHTFAFPLKILRGTMVEWLQWLGYGAESRLKVVSSRLGFALPQLENSHCQPSSKWVPLQIREG